MTGLTAEGTAAKGGAILALRFAAAAALNYGFGVVLAWVLVPAEFGTVSAIQTIILLAALVLSAGFPWALAWKVAGEHADDSAAAAADLRTALLANLILGTGFAVCMLALQLGGLPLVPRGSLLLLGTVAATFPLMAVNVVLFGMLQGTRRFAALGAAQAIEILTKCLLGLVLVLWLGMGAEGVAVGFLGGAVVASCVSIRALRDRLPGAGPLAKLRSYAVAWPIWLGTTSFGGLFTVDLLGMLLVGRGHGVTVRNAAEYQVCAILARAAFYVGDAIIDAVFPFMSSASTKESARDWFGAAWRWIPLFIVPGQLVLILAPGPLLHLFFPAQYGQALILVKLLSVGTLALVVADMHMKGLYAIGRADVAGRLLPGALLLEVVALVVLVPSEGAQGAAKAFCIGSGVAAVALTVAHDRVHRLGPIRGEQVATYALALLPLVVALLAASHVGDAEEWVLVAAGLVLYAGLCWGSNLLSSKEKSRLRRVVTAWIVPRESAAQRGAARHSATGARATRTRAGTRRHRWAGTLYAERWLVLGCAAVAAFPMLYGISRSPDTVFDEVVYTRAAQNVASGWHLTWTTSAFFVHPPLAFLAQSGWLLLTGNAHAPLDEAIGAARLLTAAVGAIDVVLIALITFRLALGAGPSRRRTLTMITAGYAALDPVLLRYSRLAIIEPLALLGCLITLHLFLTLRGKSWRLYVPVIGLASGLTLLTKEITFFLLAVPLVFAIGQRDSRLAAKTAGGLLAGVICWFLFPLWAVQLGLGGAYTDVQFATLRRLIGLVQITGWNRPGVSFAGAVERSAQQYLSSYVVLFVGGIVFIWLALRHNGPAAQFLTAWLIVSFGFGTYTLALGTLNEQFFVYVLPAALVAAVFGMDAAVLAVQRRRLRPARHARERRHTEPKRTRQTRSRLSLSGVVALLCCAASALFVAVVATRSWAHQYHSRNDGVFRATRFIDRSLPTCAAVNASGDPQKYSLLLDGRPFTTFAVGAAALSEGVHYYLLAPNDAFAHYGTTTATLQSWIRTNGTRLARFASSGYGGVELWQVPSSSYNPLADIMSVPGGNFVNTVGSRCGGFTVLDGPAGPFRSAWQGLGGKALVGVPLTRPWSVGGSSERQIFAGVVLASAPSVGGTVVRPLPLVADLASSAPQIYAQLGLPQITVGRDIIGTDSRAAALLDDGPIALAYLRGQRATPVALSEAAQRYGAPLGPAQRMADGWIRQPFAGAVLQRRDRADSPVQLAPIGRAAMAGGIVSPPAQARQPLPAPTLPPAGAPAQPTSVRPFAIDVAAMLVTFAGIAQLGRRSRRRRRLWLSAESRKVAV